MVIALNGWSGGAWAMCPDQVCIKQQQQRSHHGDALATNEGPGPAGCGCGPFVPRDTASATAGDHGAEPCSLQPTPREARAPNGIRATCLAELLILGGPGSKGLSAGELYNCECTRRPNSPRYHISEE